MKWKANLKWFLKNYKKLYRGKLIVSKTPFGCKPGEFKVYIKHERGQLGSIWKSPCMPGDEAEELIEELRQWLRD